MVCYATVYQEWICFRYPEPKLKIVLFTKSASSLLSQCHLLSRLVNPVLVTSALVCDGKLVEPGDNRYRISGASALVHQNFSQRQRRSPKTFFPREIVLENILDQILPSGMHQVCRLSERVCRKLIQDLGEKVIHIYIYVLEKPQTRKRQTLERSSLY